MGYTALAGCYLAAGSPAISLLLHPSVIGDGLALKPITYHWANLTLAYACLNARIGIRPY